MIKSTWIILATLALVSTFLIISVNPVEAVSGWRAAFDELLARITNLNDRVTALEASSGSLSFYNRTNPGVIPPNSVGVVVVNCDTGDKATGGGYEIVLVPTNTLHIIVSEPAITGFNVPPSGWTIVANNTATEAAYVIAEVVCADTTP